PGGARSRSDPARARVCRRRDRPGGHALRSHRGAGEVTRRDLRARVLILAALLAAAFGGLTGRLAWLQVVKRAELAQLAERQYSRTVALYAQRGPILDRQGMPLATSTPTESLFVQPRSVGDPVRVTARLAPIVGRDALGREVAAPHVLEPPQPGHGVMLTIDRTIQYIAEREIDAAYRRTGARSAMAVVLDPRTGEVLALVIRPTFNPNTFLD